MKSKGEAGNALKTFIQDVGIPSAMHTDGAREETVRVWGKTIKDLGIRQTTTEPYSPWQNRAESTIWELKKCVPRTIARTRGHKRLWDYCMQWHAEIRSLTALPNYRLDGRVPHEIVTGNTPNITEYIEFDWEQYVWYYDIGDGIPEEKESLGRWAGVAHRVGQVMCYWILNDKGNVLARSTVGAVTQDELATDAVKAMILEYDTKVNAKIGNNNSDTDFPSLEGAECPGDMWDVDEDFEPEEPEGDMPEADDFTPEAFDKYIAAQVQERLYKENGTRLVTRSGRAIRIQSWTPGFMR